MTGRKYYPGSKLFYRGEWWHFVRYGKPRKGEHYISGAVVAVYEAPNDIDAEYWIVKHGI